MSRTDAVSPNRQLLLREAADWLVRLDASELSHAEQELLQRWYQASPEHERVWQAACELNSHFSRVPNLLAKPVLGRERIQRRAVLKSLLGAGLLLPLGLVVMRNKPWQPVLADYRSATGEQRSLTLADGSELMLNTDTALDVHFDHRQRLIRLYEGELFVRTAKDPIRRFSVMTAQGSVHALGTEFAVRCFPGVTQVTVAKEAVMVTPGSGVASQRLTKGQQCHFSPVAIESIQDAQPESLAWRRGELIVDSWQLDRFIQELSRYRRGVLRCDSDIANRQVSGVFQVNNTDQALEVLVQLLNLKVTKFTDYWVSLGAGSITHTS